MWKATTLGRQHIISRSGVPECSHHTASGFTPRGIRESSAAERGEERLSVPENGQRSHVWALDDRHEAMLSDCVLAGHYLGSVSSTLNKIKKAHKNDPCVVSSSVVAESPGITAYSMSCMSSH